MEADSRKDIRGRCEENSMHAKEDSRLKYSGLNVAVKEVQ